MTDTSLSRRPRLLLAIAALATVVLYWTGLHGPFLLDDAANLAPLQNWLDGRAGLIELVLGNSSGTLGRPLSVLSLWFSAATGGMHPFPFKLGNLLIHILCGLAGWQMMRRLLAEEPRFTAKANLTAAILATLWLLHPINVSTVLYAVQRMAQLSTLSVLLAVWVYVLARRQLADGDTRAASTKLFVLFPLLLVAGLFSKENAAVAPALCLVIELAYFTHRPRPGKALPVFYTLFLLLPALAAITIMAVAPEKLFGLYATRDFTMLERLLSQPRALMEYLGLIAWPRGGMMGVYVDDFIVSTGLLSPASTLMAWLALLTISTAAVLIRKQAPSVFAGWFFFLVAHSVESTILPLELYFEHRNYLPLFGILLAAAGMTGWLLGFLVPAPARNAHIAFGISAVAAVAFATVTWQQVQVWKSMDTIVAQAIANRPLSLRAALEKASADVSAHRWEDVRTTMNRLANSPISKHQFTAQLSLLVLDCLEHGEAAGDRLIIAESARSGGISLTDVLTYNSLAKAVLDGRCGSSVTPLTVADSITRVIDKAAKQPDNSKPKWLLRALAAKLYVSAGSYDDAIAQARLAWQPEVSDTAIGGILIQLQMRMGDMQGASQTLAQIDRRTPSYQHQARLEIEKTRAQIEQTSGESASGR